MYGQTQIPEALMGAMLIEQGAQKGQFQPVTRDGQPTVAARLMQQAAPQPAGVGQAMEQAGLAGQIQAMKMQQAQQAMMQQAMSQQQPQGMAGGGLANLNVDIDGFADGGIVGYAGSEDSYVVDPEMGGGIEAILADEGAERSITPEEARRRREEAARMEFLERSAPELAARLKAGRTAEQQPAPVANDQRQASMDALRAAEQRISAPAKPPAAPVRQEPQAVAPSGPAAASSAAFYDQAMAELNKLKTKPVSQQEGVNAGIEALAADDEMRRRLGLPTLAEQYSRMSDEDKALAAERQALIAGRLREAQEKRSSGQLGAFLRSARGRTLGDTLGAAERGREAFEAGLTSQIRGFEDLQIEIKGLQLQKQNALNKARDDIAMGRKKEAMASLQTAQNAENEIGVKRAELLRYRAGDVSKEGIERARIAEAARARREGMDTRKQSADESLLKSYDQGIATAVERIEKTLEGKHQMAKLFRMNPAAAESNPKAYQAYIKDYNDLYNRTIVPLEKNRDALRERLQGYAGWGQVNVQ
jgi:hypothetical protein